MAIQFTKLHGTGNDFLVVDGSTEELDWSSLACRLLDRHCGVGADGLLVVAPSAKAAIRMREFNPDGSEAEMSGNGIRCFAKYVLERRIAPPDGAILKVETGAGVLTVEPHWEDGRVIRARVSMGEPVLRWADVPVDPRQAGPRDDRLLDRELAERLGIASEELFFDGRLTVDGEDVTVTAVSMGNPHAVRFVERPVSNHALDTIGPKVEHHPAFPRRANYHAVNVLGRDRLAVTTWERGTGQTLACGTGACAAVVTARLHGYVDDAVVVQVPGGELAITWPGHGPVVLDGPVAEVFSGEWAG